MYATVPLRINANKSEKHPNLQEINIADINTRLYIIHMEHLCTNTCDSTIK